MSLSSKYGFRRLLNHVACATALTIRWTAITIAAVVFFFLMAVTSVGVYNAYVEGGLLLLLGFMALTAIGIVLVGAVLILIVWAFETSCRI